MTVTHLTGDVLDQVRGLPDGSVDLVATSPPFLALRNYNDLRGQWGSEPDPASFLDNLLELVVELRRVLAPHGSIAVELGDSYAGSGGSGGDYNPGGLRDQQARFAGTARAERRTAKYGRVQADGLDPIINRNGKVQGGGVGWPLPKSLCLTPTLFAASLAYGRNLLRPDHQLDPWRVRNLIVWARDNPAPGALADKVRPATSYITVACPSDRRWFDLDAVRGPGSPNSHARAPKGVKRQPKRGKATADGRGGGWRTLDELGDTTGGAPPLDHWHDEYDGDLTWLINTAGSSLAHYAMWPAKLAERLILSMCPAEVCRACGEPRRRLVGPAEYRNDDGTTAAQLDERWRHGRVGQTGDHLQMRGHMTRSAPTLGWSDCGHGDYRPGHVLDPFAGTGTTLAVAAILGRDATGVDLDPANPGLYRARYAECWAALRPAAGTSPLTPHGEQLDLLGMTGG